jgi:protein-disulfide isomerase
MTRVTLSIAFAALLFATALGGCQQDNKELEAKIAEIAKGQEEIKAMLKAGAGRGAAGGAPGGQQQQRPPRPTADPSKTYSVPIEGAPFEGPADAKVTIVKAYEYACPYCEKVRPTMDELKKQYGKDIKIVYKHFVVHPQVATSPALAACAAHKQGKFPAMENILWEKIFKARKFDKDRCWLGGAGAKGAAEAGGGPGCENLEMVAKEIGLDLNKFRTDMVECQAIIQRDQKELGTVGVGATPAFFINGRFLSGAQPTPAFQALVDEELKKANEKIASGAVSQADYYKTFVIEKGEKKAEIK